MSYTNGLDNPELYFQTKLYTGNGSTQSITLDGDEDMQPDWVWIKSRGDTSNHRVYDSVRGATKVIYSNLTNVEGTDSNGVTAFNSDGFSLGNEGQSNGSGVNFASWNWKAGTSFTNDASSTGIGSIDSTGSVNTDAGFSIVSYTGTGSNGTIKHGLSSAPNMVIVKERNGTGQWSVQSTSLSAADKVLHLQSTAASATKADHFNSTFPTNSVFSVGTSGNTNGSSQTFIAYCFADIQGYSKFGNYTGNGNADGTFVYTGFKPAFILLKDYTSGSGYNWVLLDNKRDPSNGLDKRLQASSNLAEYTDVSNFCDFTSNGFKWTGSHANWNGSGVGYIYMTFAENPFVTSTGVPATAR
jgi:hypothetical protein